MFCGTVEFLISLCVACRTEASGVNISLRFIYLTPVIFRLGTIAGQTKRQCPSSPFPAISKHAKHDPI